MANPKMVPLVFTEQFDATRSFYLDRLGATPVMEDGNNYLQVRFGTDDVPEPTDKPWGWRSFLLPDPSGVTLDFYHVIADDAQDAAS
jgi:hypothetical protein